jgi:hypothetical protein
LEFVGINSCRVQVTLSYLPIQMSMMITTIISSLVAAWSTKVSTQNGMHTIHAPPGQLHVTLLPPRAPELPYTLCLYEAFTIVMQVDSGEGVRSRAFVSPISVNATIG